MRKAKLKPGPIAYLGDTVPKTLNDFHAKRPATWDNPNPKGMDQTQTRTERIIKTIKKLDRRIKKAKKFLNRPDSAETTELRAKVQRWEEHIKRHIGYLKQIQHDLSSINRREISKFENKQAVENLQAVKLESGRLVPYVSQARKKAEEQFEKLKK